MDDNEQNNNNPTSSKAIPQEIKDVINQQSEKIEALEAKTRTELQDARLIAEHAAEIGANKAIEKILGLVNQQQQAAQAQQPASITVNDQPQQNPQTGDSPINLAGILSKIDANLINRAADIILSKMLGTDNDSSGLGEVMLSNKKRFDKWVDLLVTRVLNKAINISIREHETMIDDATDRALSAVNPLHEQ